MNNSISFALRAGPPAERRQQGRPNSAARTSLLFSSLSLSSRQQMVLKAGRQRRAGRASMASMASRASSVYTAFLPPSVSTHHLTAWPIVSFRSLFFFAFWPSKTIDPQRQTKPKPFPKWASVPAKLVHFRALLALLFLSFFLLAVLIQLAMGKLSTANENNNNNNKNTGENRGERKEKR